jgi:hypothetical protein
MASSVNPIRMRAEVASGLGAPAPGVSRDRAEPGHPLRRAIFGLEARLRRAQGIVEFSNSPDCVLRICVRRVRSPVVLVDAGLESGDCVVDLHYLNEHLPRLGRSGLAWGAGLRRRLLRSFEALAAALESDPRLHDVRAVRARMNSPFSRRPFEMARFAAHFGLVPARQTEPVSLVQRVDELGGDLWFCALAWAYSPETLRRRGVLRWRGDVWISRAQLLERFRPR